MSVNYGAEMPAKGHENLFSAFFVLLGFMGARLACNQEREHENQKEGLDR
jgi:hypothetical protein